MMDAAGTAETLYDQLIFELNVRDLDASVRFFEQFGFGIHRRQGNFVELIWGRARIFLEETERAPEQTGQVVGNVRVPVPDVDRYWETAQRLGVPVVLPIEDRYYGLRDFTIAGPDGIGLRFASWLPDAIPD
jgi:catechol 2,3-dioxygenase-like lactoylglutathione lyase family enzyme